MQIVIDIEDTAYTRLVNSGYVSFNVINVVRQGTPLPKGHRRLIDEKEIDTVVNGVFNIFDTYSPETFLNVIHNQCIEAVEADRTESEEIDVDTVLESIK